MGLCHSSSLGKRKGIVRDALQTDRASEPQTGLAASLLAWLETLCRKGLRGLRQGQSERRMKLLETLHLGGKRQLMLVVCDGHRYLLGLGGDSVQSIAEMNHSPVVESAPPSSKSFQLGDIPVSALQSSQKEMTCNQ